MQNAGAELYKRMREDDFTPVIETAIRELGCATKEEAENLFDALLQWFSLIPMLRPGEALQMLRKVDPLWHAFILNTKLYREFCDRHIGYYVDHDPMEVTNSKVPKETYAAFTLSLLKQEFGQTIQPSLNLLAEEATCCYWSVKKCKTPSMTVWAKPAARARAAGAA